MTFFPEKNRTIFIETPAYSLGSPKPGALRVFWWVHDGWEHKGWLMPPITGE